MLDGTNGELPAGLLQATRLEATHLAYVVYVRRIWGYSGFADVFSVVLRHERRHTRCRRTL